MEYSIKTSSILKQQLENSSSVLGSMQATFGMVSLAFATTLLGSSQHLSDAGDSCGIPGNVSIKSSVKKKRIRKKSLNSTEKRLKKLSESWWPPVALLSVHTQSYDVLQKGDLSGTVELEPRNLTEVKLGWKQLLAAFLSQVRRTVAIQRHTILF